MWSVIRVFLFDTENGGVKRLTKRMTSRRDGRWVPVCRLSSTFYRLYERPRQVSYGCECEPPAPDQRREPGQIETRPANVLPRSTTTPKPFPFSPPFDFARDHRPQFPRELSSSDLRASTGTAALFTRRAAPFLLPISFGPSAFPLKPERGPCIEAYF